MLKRRKQIDRGGARRRPALLQRDVIAESAGPDRTIAPGEVTGQMQSLARTQIGRVGRRRRYDRRQHDVHGLKTLIDAHLDLLHRPLPWLAPGGLAG
jgi:hypothetical protein